MFLLHTRKIAVRLCLYAGICCYDNRKARKQCAFETWSVGHFPLDIFPRTFPPSDEGECPGGICPGEKFSAPAFTWNYP